MVQWLIGSHKLTSISDEKDVTPNALAGVRQTHGWLALVFESGKDIPANFDRIGNLDRSEVGCQ